VTKAFSRRNLLAIWLVLLTAATIVASQNWYTVHYVFGTQLKTLQSSGLAAWPLVSGALSLWGLGFLSTLVLRGWLRSVVISLVALLTIPVSIALLSAFREALPPTLGTQVEKATGIAGGEPGSSSEAIRSITASPLAEVFLVLGFLLSVVILTVAIVSFSWSKTKSKDKYQRASKPKAQDSATVADDSKTKAEVVEVVEVDPTEVDSIALWDSQR
jgi:hypothetical protein